MGSTVAPAARAYRDCDGGGRSRAFHHWIVPLLLGGRERSEISPFLVAAAATDETFSFAARSSFKKKNMYFLQH